METRAIVALVNEAFNAHDAKAIMKRYEDNALMCDDGPSRSYSLAYRVEGKRSCDALANVVSMPFGDFKASYSSGKGRGFKDMSGEQFGWITCVAPSLYVDAYGKPQQHIYWLVKCRHCGSYHLSRQNNIADGSVKSCGCISSVAEETARKVLMSMKKNGLKFTAQKTFQTMRGVKGGLLRLDFYIEYKNRIWAVECDGPQHEKATGGWSQQADFEEQYANDQLKNSWCRANGLDLIRIPYKQGVIWEMLNIETSPYII